MIYKRSPKDGKIKAMVFINYGNNSIKKADVSVHPGASVLEILKTVSEVQCILDESATSHMGSMITAIDGFKNDLTHFWLFFLREEDDSGWRLPMEMPDAVLIRKSCMIGWRYHKMQESGLARSGNQLFGPFYSDECISRVKKCNHQF